MTEKITFIDLDDLRIGFKNIFRKSPWGRFSFRLTITPCKDCVRTISGIDLRFFAINRKRNWEKNVRGRFLNFVMWPCEDSDKVENYRLLENCSMDFDENQAAWSLFDTVSAENIKSAKIKIWKNRFFGNFAYLHM